MNKFELTTNVHPEDPSLFQIRALKDIPGTLIKAGDVGGYVQYERNLSQTGSCWIHHLAMVYGDACVSEDAHIYDHSCISGNATVNDHASISCNAHIYSNATVSGYAIVSGYAQVYGNARVLDVARVLEDACVHGWAQVYGNARVYGNTHVYGSAHVFDNVNLSGTVRVCDNARISGNAMVCGNTHVSGNAEVQGRAKLLGNARLDAFAVMSFGTCTTDITSPSNLADSIRCQTGLAVANNEIICYKLVKQNLTSYHDNNFQYRINEWIEEPNTEQSNKSCAPGLHFSHSTYWDYHVISAHPAEIPVLLQCKVLLEDVITCQEGKIRAKKCFVMAICQ